LRRTRSEGKPNLESKEIGGEESLDAAKGPFSFRRTRSERDGQPKVKGQLKELNFPETSSGKGESSNTKKGPLVFRGTKSKLGALANRIPSSRKRETKSDRDTSIGGFAFRRSTSEHKSRLAKSFHAVRARSDLFLKKPTKLARKLSDISQKRKDARMEDDDEDGIMDSAPGVIVLFNVEPESMPKCAVSLKEIGNAKPKVRRYKLAALLSDIFCCCA
jgi:hypothetical protein